MDGDLAAGGGRGFGDISGIREWGMRPNLLWPSRPAAREVVVTCPCLPVTELKLRCLVGPCLTGPSRDLTASSEVANRCHNSSLETVSPSSVAVDCNQLVNFPG
jgi:hypothetical protein